MFELFREEKQISEVKMAVQRCLGFWNYYRKYVPRLSEPLALFYKVLKSNEQVIVSKKLVQHFEGINKELNNCCDLAQQQPLLIEQIARLTDACFAAAGYASLLKTIHTKQSFRFANHMPQWPTAHKHSPQPNQDVNLFGKNS